MRLSEFKNSLKELESINIKLPNGALVPQHFHITEVGQVQKNFIDCGGVIRREVKVNFQLWESVDTWHRLTPKKLLGIIQLSEDKLEIQDAEIEVEYQGDTIQKYGIELNAQSLQLVSLNTDCLAKDKCGVPTTKSKIKLSQLKNTDCSPNSGCC